MPMVQTSTTENLILYLFNETKMVDSVLIQREIDQDAEVENEFENIKSALDYLDKALIAPSEKSISKIMAYAHSHN
jgi:hypothetical protein